MLLFPQVWIWKNKINPNIHDFLFFLTVPPHSYDTTCKTSCEHCSSDETVEEWFQYNAEGDTVVYTICETNCGVIGCEEDAFGRLCTCGK